jgi:hypothetical protein
MLRMSVERARNAGRHPVGPASAERPAKVTRLSAHGYEIRIKGLVGEAVRAAFEEMHVAVKPVETVVFGEVQDQAALHGLLDRIQELGLELVEVRRFPGGPGSGNDLAN